MARNPKKKSHRSSGRPSVKRAASSAASERSAAVDLATAREILENPRTRGRDFPIVGVGASAGGLESFTQFLEHLPAASRMAFVLIQHLDPTHESQLTQILSRKSAMPVREVYGEMPVEAGRVYVIPPGDNLTIEKGVLRTVRRPTGAGVRNMPIDDFLQALAKDQGSGAFGVILSGTASDGALGLKAIKAEGGITFAQDPDSAKFDGMPRSAIATGAVDFVLTPGEIAVRLLAVSGHSYLHPAPDRESDFPQGIEGELHRIFVPLRTATGVDFTHYKRSTILRRIKRRMALHGIEDLKEYARRIEQDASEAKILAQDFLINVTTFFREPESHRILKETVFPALLQGRSPADPIRIWIPGCATGEEAYSLAMGLTEFLDDRSTHPAIQIFATDISEPAIARARSGVYLESALGAISPERLKRFFVKTAGVYQIGHAIRELCVFARQDLTKDPPFSKMDLISCCNLLIYLGPVLQKKAMTAFHYALNPRGFLILGSSESAAAFAESFHAIDRKQKIYSKRGDSMRLTFDFPDRNGAAVDARPRAAVENAGPVKEAQNEADRMLLAAYAPAGVIIDDAMRILQIRGDTGPYLQLAPGAPTTELSRMVRPGLLAGLNNAVRKARLKGSTVRETGLRAKDGKQFRSVDLRVSPIRGSSGKERCFLVLFEDSAPREAATRGKAKSAKSVPEALARADQEIERLERELTATREYLQSIIEAQETAAEELRSAGEEAQASNEELDTAKEELQASNEELNTVNEELSARNSELSHLNNDLRKLLESINVPLVMVGRDLRVRRFTAAIGPFLNLIPADQGRTIGDLHSSAIPDFRELLVNALDGGEVKHREIQDLNGRWLSMRILPYKGPGGAIDGAIATLIDIDDMKRARDFAKAVVDTVREPLIVLDADLRIRNANRAFYQVFQVDAGAAEGHSIFDIGAGQWDAPRLRQLLEEILPKRLSLEDFEVEHNYERIGARTMLLNAREIKHIDDERMILLAIDDITMRKRAAEDLRRTNEDLKQFIYAASHDLQEPLRMVVAYTQLLASRCAGKLDGEENRFAGYAIEGALRMEAMVSGLREFWRVSERAEEQRAPVDLNSVLKNVLLILERSIAESEAVVTSDPLPSLKAAETPLIQLFQNLIGNAIKYRAEAPPRIHVSALKNQSEWIFSIQDNGLGIDPQYATQVFRVFKRLHAPDRYSGTGIGLAICQKIVERYGGRIWVEANSGQGSVFKFTMPA